MAAQKMPAGILEGDIKKGREDAPGLFFAYAVLLAAGLLQDVREAGCSAMLSTSLILK